VELQRAERWKVAAGEEPKNGVEYGMCISVNQGFLINMEYALAKHESVWLDLCMLNMQLKSWENIFSR
jgi:hypothetical protein